MGQPAIKNQAAYDKARNAGKTKQEAAELAQKPPAKKAPAKKTPAKK